MSKSTGRPRGRPPGSKNKAKPVELTFTRIKELFSSCYTPAQQRKRFMALKPDQQFRMMALLEPKERPEKAEDVTIRVISEGIRPTTCPACGHVFSATSDEKVSGGTPEVKPIHRSKRDAPYIPEVCEEVKRMREKPKVELTPADVPPPEEEIPAEKFLEEVNRKLAREDAELRAQNEERVKMGLEPLSNVKSLFSGTGIKGC